MDNDLHHPWGNTESLAQHQSVMVEWDGICSELKQNHNFQRSQFSPEEVVLAILHATALFSPLP